MHHSDVLFFAAHTVVAVAIERTLVTNSYSRKQSIEISWRERPSHFEIRQTIYAGIGGDIEKR